MSTLEFLSIRFLIFWIQKLIFKEFLGPFPIERVCLKKMTKNLKHVQYIAYEIEMYNLLVLLFTKVETFTEFEALIETTSIK